MATPISTRLACDSSTVAGANQPSCAATSTPPNSAVATPKAWIDRSMPTPWRRTRPMGPENRLDRNAPAAIDAVSTPTVIAPPPSSTAPIAGNSASG